nr:uncharacterized protein LOC109158375 [Ipomoea batatas]
MAEQPSRALVLYGDRMARFLSPSHTHLHSLASRACCGFLSLPHSPPSDWFAENEDGRIVREFAELLDASEAYNEMNKQDLSEAKSQDKFVTPTVSQRFMGMKAAIVTDNSSLNGFCSHLGFTVLQLEDLVHSSFDVAKSSLLASELLKLLGFQEGKVLETSQFDLVIVHVGSSRKSTLEDIEHANGLVGELINTAQPGTGLRSHLHLSVLLSFGADLENENFKFSVADHIHENSPELSRLFPRQSYTLKGGKPRENVRKHCPMLVAQWQDAVTRKDRVESYSFEDFKETATSKTTEGRALLKWKNTLHFNADVLHSWSIANLHNICWNWTGITCNNIGAIYKIKLDDFSLSGTLESLDFVSFPNLTRFSLYNNNFTGSIPYAIANLSHLVFLDLSSNYFVSFIPSEIGRLTKFRLLNLRGNHLCGTIPSEISYLQHLSSLSLNDNSLTGQIPEAIFSFKLVGEICSMEL